MPEQLFTDGGVVGPNPSLIGITWAWVLVINGQRMRWGSGFISPQEAGVEKCSNNFAECLAALRGLAAVGPRWEGVLYTDSQVTKYRLEGHGGVSGLPRWAADWLLEIRRGRRYRVELLAGHPTKKDILRGIAARNGKPVSEHNQWCDKECTRIAKEIQCRRK